MKTSFRWGACLNLIIWSTSCQHGSGLSNKASKRLGITLVLDAGSANKRIAEPWDWGDISYRSQHAHAINKPHWVTELLETLSNLNSEPQEKYMDIVPIAGLRSSVLTAKHESSDCFKPYYSLVPIEGVFDGINTLKIWQRWHQEGTILCHSDNQSSCSIIVEAKIDSSTLQNVLLRCSVHQIGRDWSPPEDCEAIAVNYRDHQLLLAQKHLYFRHIFSNCSVPLLITTNHGLPLTSLVRTLAKILKAQPFDLKVTLDEGKGDVVGYSGFRQPTVIKNIGLLELVTIEVKIIRINEGAWHELPSVSQASHGEQFLGNIALSVEATIQTSDLTGLWHPASVELRNRYVKKIIERFGQFINSNCFKKISHFTDEKVLYFYCDSLNLKNSEL